MAKFAMARLGRQAVRLDTVAQLSDASARQARRLWATWDPLWRRLRAAVLSDEPMCRHCAAQGRDTPAVDVDHIDGRAAELHDYRRSNLQALCRSCHCSKTATEQRHG